jgi:flagellar biosynthetic protein FlhB
MAGNDDDRTEEPTQRRLQQAREKGDIIYSPEVGAALSLVALTGVVAFMSGPLMHGLASSFVNFIAAPAQFATDPSALKAIGTAVIFKAASLFAMVALALALSGLAARYVQDQPTFNAGRLKPDLSKLSPANGFQRVFGKPALSSFVKSLVKFGIVGGAMAYALWPHDAELSRISFMDPAALLPFVQQRAVNLMIALATAAAVLAAIDYIFTRQSYMSRMKMSRREIKEEMRQSEGDPAIKAKLRAIRMEKSRRRMMQNVPQASVVVTNPTHYAVALRYEQGETPAPICLAKGVDDIAQRIRAVAGEHNIPIVEDPPLARALYATAELDEPIPREHYEAAAKVIGFVMRLARRRARRSAPRRPGGP